ncbi:MAG: hypothetical protein R2911_19080 [Caldilineaceae bacterium]
MVYGQLVRGEMLVQKQVEYTMAARVIGCTNGRIITRHLLPNVIASALTFWMTDMSLGILLGASLGYLGLGPSRREVGPHGGRRQKLYDHRPLDLDFPRPGPHPGRHHLQHDRRRAGRSAAAAGVGVGVGVGSRD